MTQSKVKMGWFMVHHLPDAILSPQAFLSYKIGYEELYIEKAPCLDKIKASCWWVPNF